MNTILIPLSHKIAKYLHGNWQVTLIHNLRDRGYLEIVEQNIRLFFIQSYDSDKITIHPDYPRVGWRNFIADKETIPSAIHVSISRGAKVIAKEIERRLLSKCTTLQAAIQNRFIELDKMVANKNDTYLTISEVSHGRPIVEDYYGTFMVDRVLFGEHSNTKWPEGEVCNFRETEKDNRMLLRLANLSQEEVEAVLELLIKIRSKV